MKMDKITSDLIIANVLERWPQTVKVFVKHRMSCPGCFMSCFDTIEDAMRIYILSRETFLREINQSIQNED